MIEFFEKIIDFITKYFKLHHFIILLGCLLIFIGLIFIINSIVKSKLRDLNNRIDEYVNLEHISIDVLNKNVYQFNKQKLSEASNSTLIAYLNNFDSKNRGPLSRWIINLLNQQNQETLYFEQINYSRKLKSYVKDIFVCRNINIERHIVHIDHYSSSLRNKKNPECPYLKADYEIDRCFFRLKKNSSTLIGLITFFSKNQREIKENYHLDRINRQIILDILIQHCDSNHLITQLKNGDIGLIILNYNKKDKFLDNINSSLVKFYALNMPSIENFHITAYINKGASINFDECMKKTKVLSNHLIDTKKYDNRLFYYEDGTEYPSRTRINAVERIKRAIIKEDFQPLIKPFFSVKSIHVSSYYFNLLSKEYPSSSKELVDIVCLAAREKEFIQVHLKKCIESLPVEEDRGKIIDVIFPVSVWMIDSLIDLIDEFKNYQTHNFIFAFDYNEYVVSNHLEFVKKLKILNDNKFELALVLNNHNTIIEDILSNIKYIIIDNQIMSSLFKKQESTNLLLSLLVKLSQKKKIIIGDDITDWTTYETLVSNKLNLFYGQFLEIQNQYNPIVSKRIIGKAKEIYRKYF